MTYHGSHAAPVGLAGRIAARFRRTPCTHESTGRWANPRGGIDRCTRCGHRVPGKVTHAGITLTVPPRPTRDQPPWKWPGELICRWRARHADVAVRLTPLTPEADGHPRRPWVLYADEPPTGPQLAALAEPQRTGTAPWPLADQAAGTAFDTCSDGWPVIWDGPSPARPYVLPEEDR